MKAAIVTAKKQLAIQQIESPQLPDGGALIRVTGCGLCGSDMDKLLNRPLKPGTVLGHEVAGKIEALAQDAPKNFSIGQRVALAHHVPCQTCHYCRHGSPSMCHQFRQTNIFPGGFSEIIAVSGDHLRHTVFPLSDDISDAEGSCIEPLACCLRAIDRIPAEAGEYAAIIGLGFIGLMTAQGLGIKGYATAGIDLKPERVVLARTHEMIAEAETDPDSFLRIVMNQTDHRGADVVFLSIVTPQTIELALKSVRDGGILLLFSAHHENIALINQNTLYFRELTVVTSYSPSLQHMQLAYDLISHRRISVSPLITHHVPLAGLPGSIREYQTRQAMKVFVTI